MQIENIQAFAHKYLDNDTTGHDYWHGKRVANLAQKLFLQDYPRVSKRQLDLLLVMGYWHDTIDEKICSNPGKVTDEMKQLLEKEEFRQDEITREINDINHMSFSKNLEHYFQLPMIGQYVQDADRIEALGAIGISRAFAFGGSHNQKIYDPAIKPQILKSHKQYRNHEATTVNHFYEKLIHLEQTMNTPAGRKIAHERTLYMHKFIDQFLKEWEGE